MITAQRYASSCFHASNLPCDVLFDERDFLQVTERYVQKALVELLNVVLDVREWEAQPKKSRGPKPDTGGWECIYTGPLLDLPTGSFGTDMSLKGESLKVRGPKATIPIASSSASQTISISSGNPITSGSSGRHAPQPPNKTPSYPQHCRPAPARSEAKSIGNQEKNIGSNKPSVGYGSSKSAKSESKASRRDDTTGSNNPSNDIEAFDDSDGDELPAMMNAPQSDHRQDGGVDVSQGPPAVNTLTKRESKHQRGGSSATVSVPLKVLTLDLGI